MRLNFETQPEISGLPLLVDIERSIGAEAAGVRIDGADVELNQAVTAQFQRVVDRFQTETLPPKHFRDCVHFAMAMSGLWMPTHRMYDPDFEIKQECDEREDTEGGIGPVALGLPNDSRCVGFGPVSFMYCHDVFGVESSAGRLCFSKMGVFSDYSLSTFEAALSDRDLEVAHPITKFALHSAGTDVVAWTDTDLR